MRKKRPYIYVSIEYRMIYLSYKFIKRLPVEEGFYALRMQPVNVVKVKIVSITMSWINLKHQKDGIYASENSRPKHLRRTNMLNDKLLTASSQCCKASLRALLFCDKPFPT